MMYTFGTGHVAAEVFETEHHLHNVERWFGAAGSPSGEVHVADRIGTTSTPLQADGGNDTWGDWLQVLGSSDTPDTAGMVKFDLHRIIFTATERSGVHFVQIAYGADGDAGLAAGNYTEFVFEPGTANLVPAPVDIINRRVDIGTKVWLRIHAVGQNTGTASFFIGLHEYDA